MAPDHEAGDHARAADDTSGIGRRPHPASMSAEQQREWRGHPARPSRQRLPWELRALGRRPNCEAVRALPTAQGRRARSRTHDFAHAHRMLRKICVTRADERASHLNSGVAWGKPRFWRSLLLCNRSRYSPGAKICALVAPRSSGGPSHGYAASLVRRGLQRRATHPPSCPIAAAAARNRES